MQVRGLDPGFVDFQAADMDCDGTVDRAEWQRLLTAITETTGLAALREVAANFATGDVKKLTAKAPETAPGRDAADDVDQLLDELNL